MKNNHPPSDPAPSSEQPHFVRGTIRFTPASQGYAEPVPEPVVFENVRIGIHYPSKAASVIKPLSIRPSAADL